MSKLIKSLNIEFQKNSGLSGLWQTVYYEGIRGHHMLFDKRTIAEAEKNPNLESKDERLSAAVIQVLSQSTYGGIRETLKNYDQNIKKDLFRLYKRALDQYQGLRRANLN